MKYTNLILTVIALLLAAIAYQQYSYRPVTSGELRKLVQDDYDAWEKRRDDVPVVMSPR